MGLPPSLGDHRIPVSLGLVNLLFSLLFCTGHISKGLGNFPGRVDFLEIDADDMQSRLVCIEHSLCFTGDLFLDLGLSDGQQVVHQHPPKELCNSYTGSIGNQGIRGIHIEEVIRCILDSVLNVHLYLKDILITR